MAIWRLHSSFGVLELESEGEGEDEALVRLSILPMGEEPDLEALPRKSKNSPVLAEAETELCEYFAGLRQAFESTLAPKGTPFQEAVWDALLDIPYGETRTYAEIAAAIGKPNASRAVGGACHNNPIAILIPCHRVVGKDGTLTGYAGGVEMKADLLALEQSYAP